MFKKRSHAKELIDKGPHFYTIDEFNHFHKMLFRAARFFGVFYNTIKQLKKHPSPSVVLDIGCGGGLFLLHLSHYFPEMQMIGVDNSTEAIEFAQVQLAQWKKQQKDLNVAFVLQSLLYLDEAFRHIDIFLATFVCHHLSDEEITAFLQQTKKRHPCLLIINDVHRHALSYWIYQLASPILFHNRLMTHDGLISIRRGFTRKEWQSLLKKAGVDRYEIKWHFPFWWQIIIHF